MHNIIKKTLSKEKLLTIFFFPAYTQYTHIWGGILFLRTMTTIVIALGILGHIIVYIPWDNAETEDLATESVSIITQLFSGDVTLKSGENYTFEILVRFKDHNSDMECLSMQPMIQQDILLFLSDQSEDALQGRRGKLEALEDISIRLKYLAKSNGKDIVFDDLIMTKMSKRL